MSVLEHLDPALVQAVGWALLHFLWQGALAAALLAALDAALARSAARLRYLAAAATLLLMLALPALTLRTLVTSAASAAPASTALREGILPPAAAAVGADAALEAGRATPGLRERLAPALPLLVALWCAGVALLSLRTLGGWALAQRIKRSGLETGLEQLEALLARLCRELQVSRPVRLLRSAAVEVPTVIGWLRPVILLPASALTQLSPLQLEVLLA